MAFNDMNSFYKEMSAWTHNTESFLYDLLESALDNAGIMDEIKKSGKDTSLESYLIACTLVDLYRRFCHHATGESWHLSSLDYCRGYHDHSYAAYREHLNLPPITIDDLLTPEALADYDPEEYEDLIEEASPNFSDFFETYVQTPYRRKIFQALKPRYGQIDLFTFMANVTACFEYHTPEQYEYDEALDEEIVTDYIELEFHNCQSFEDNAKENQDDIFNNMQYMGAFEWFDRIYG